MPTGALTFGGTTIIGNPSATMGNGEGYWNRIDQTPHAPQLQIIEKFNVTGLEVLRVGRNNTASTAGRISFGNQGRQPTIVYFTSAANYSTWLTSMENLWRATPVGSLVYGSTTVNNCVMLDLRPSPPKRLALGNAVLAVRLSMVFMRLS